MVSLSNEEGSLFASCFEVLLPPPDQPRRVAPSLKSLFRFALVHERVAASLKPDSKEAILACLSLDTSATNDWDSYDTSPPGLEGAVPWLALFSWVVERVASSASLAQVGPC